MENVKKEGSWSGVVKNERKPFDITEWPSVDEKPFIKKEKPDVVEQEMHVDPPDFASFEKLAHKRKRKGISYKLSQAFSNEKTFEPKYSSKVRKMISKTTYLGRFMNKKKKKDVKSADLEKILQRIKESQIVTFKGRKREIPKRKMSRLKKNILRIRAEKHQDIDAIPENPTPINPEVIESIENLKIKPTKEYSNSCPNKNPFGGTQEVIQHSRQFRSYCTNITSSLLCDLTEQLIVQLRIFQTKQHQKNPEKYKKRYITGINESKKFLELNKVKLLIIAPDLEPNAGVGGLDETIEQMKAICEENHIPFLFSLKRRKIGYALVKKVPVSCVGILSYEGCEEMYGKLMDELCEQIARYKNAIIIS